MSLNNILKTIKSEAEAEAEEIRNNGKEEAGKVKAQIEEKLKKEQEKILAQFKGEMERQVKQVKFRKESAKKTALLKQKRAILDKVYKQVAEIVTSDDNIYEQTIRKATKELPQMEDAEIMLDSEKGEKTKKALGTARLKYTISDETINAKGGFILKSKILEIDNTVETLVEQIRNESEIDVCRILFE